MSDTVNAAVKLVEEALAEKGAELEAKKKAAGIEALEIEYNDLAAFLKKAQRGSKTASAPATSDEDLIAAVGACSAKGPVQSPEIAKFLEVDPRTISRRLSKFATDGVISGNKDDGYSAA